MAVGRGIPTVQFGHSRRGGDMKRAAQAGDSIALDSWSTSSRSGFALMISHSMATVLDCVRSSAMNDDERRRRRFALASGGERKREVGSEIRQGTRNSLNRRAGCTRKPNYVGNKW